LSPTRGRVQALLTADFTEPQLVRLHARVDVERAGWGVTGTLMPTQELIERLQGKDILIVAYEQLTPEVFSACPRLALIASVRGGPEFNIPIAAATAAGVPVLYTVGRTEFAVSEYTLGLMLCLARNIPRGDRLVKDGILASASPPPSDTDITWALPSGSHQEQLRTALFGFELHGKTLGLVGLGNIGAAVARLASAFGMRMLAFDPYAAPELAAELQVALVPLSTLLRESDFVSVHARLGPETAGLLGAAELAQMKPSAYVINTARAGLIDETALVEALRAGRLAGAALDVFWKEPLEPSHPLLAFAGEQVTEAPKLLLTPHLAGPTVEIPEHHSQMVVDDVLAYLSGSRPAHVANPDVFGTPAFRSRGARLYTSTPAT
jgi:D-3-phosphoglycerate dehydrogenase